jgi:RNA polymerase sigma-B factor
MPDFTRLTDRQLDARHRAGDPRARDVLIERYLPMARGLALRYRRTSEPLDDLIQVASLGLVKAVDKWEPDRGLVFSSYAVPTILGELRRYFRDRTWAVRPPRRLLELALEIEASRDRVSARIGREATAAELSAHLARPTQEIFDAIRAGRARWAAAVEGDHDELLAVGVAERAYEDAEDAATFERLVAVLDPRAREVLRLRFREGLRQCDIGCRIGASQMQVSRIIRRALEELAVSVRATAFGPQLELRS